VTSSLAGSDGVPSKLTLRGVQNKADIGLLSLFEHYGSCQVNLKLRITLDLSSNLKYPIIILKDKWGWGQSSEVTRNPIQGSFI